MVSLRNRLMGKDPNKLVRKGHTHLCIEGYPRSANSFCTRLFWLANPDEREHVAHHTHAIGNIARALRYKIPVIVLIRDPADAIVSACLGAGIDDLDYRARYYIEFYEWLRPRKDQVVIADFNVATRNFNEIIGRVNEKYNVSFKRVANLPETQEQLLHYLRSPELYAEKMRIRGKEGWMPAPAPSAERAKKKDELGAIVLQHRLVGVAQALYRDMIS